MERRPTMILARSRGFTLTEVIIASAISSIAAIGLMSLTVYSTKVGRSITIQQRSVQQMQSVVEGIDRAIRPALVNLRILDDDNNAAAAGNCVEFAWQGEIVGQRNIRLISADNDLQSPWDNQLVYDPDSTRAGDEVVLANWVTPLPDQSGIFTIAANGAIVVRLRIGDSLDPAQTKQDDAHSGPGQQGVGVEFTVGARNKEL